MGYFEQSEKLYENLLNSIQESGDDRDKIDVTIALGLVHNMHNGPEAACNLLLQE